MPAISVGIAQAFAQMTGAPRTGNALTVTQAQDLIRAASYFVTVHAERLSKPVVKVKATRVVNGRQRSYQRVEQRSLPGEYPRADTGNLRASVGFYPASIQEIMRTGKIRVGYRPRGWYGAYLEVVYRRKGLRHTMRSLYQRMAALAGVPFRYEYVNTGVR